MDSVYNAVMRIGIYGGTFDPIHFGHLSVARHMKSELNLDEVFFVVTAVPPHKRNIERTPDNLRYEMVRLALENEPGMTASADEIKAGGISYTFETLNRFKKRYQDAELFFIVGADMLEDFPTWRRPDEILRLANIAAVKRPNSSDDIALLGRSIETRFGGRVYVSEFSGPDISSTGIRQLIFNAKPIEGLTPLPVELFLYENGLYVPDSVKTIRDRLAGSLSMSRYRHTMLTVREAVALANRYEVDADSARLAAILHDCMKLPDKELFKYCLEMGIELSEEEKQCSYLIHSRLGAIAANRDYGVKDEAVLHAISVHTLGALNMNKLDKIIYLADKLEPSRTYPGIEALRQTAYVDLDAGVLAVMRHTIDFVENKGGAVNRTTLEAIDMLSNNYTIKTEEG